MTAHRSTKRKAGDNLINERLKMNHLIDMTLRRKTIVAVIAMSCLFAALLPTAFAESVQIIYYSAAAKPTDNRSDYYITLLETALRKSGVRYELRANHVSMPLKRAMQHVGANGGIDVFWGPTTREKEENYLPVRIPIDKGILGWRLFFVRARDRQLFADVHSLAQLQLYSAGLQRDWSDIAIFRANGLKVVGADAYETMFAMLAEERFQYFPRGIVEIWNESKTYANLNLEIEQGLALHYPVYSYYFVKKSNVSLARSIEDGLRAAMADGSFDRLFEKFNGESIKRARLGTRTVLELSNPLLPDTVPALRDTDLIH
jgi:hypothetical protein